MPYRCVHCSKIYDDDAKEVIEGCECKSKLFFFIKKEKLKQILESEKKGEEPNLSPTEKKQMEEDVREITGVKDSSVPVYLDFESIAVIKPGKYLIDVQKLLSSKNPRIYKLEDGKYIVDLSTSFNKD